MTSFLKLRASSCLSPVPALLVALALAGCGNEPAGNTADQASPADSGTDPALESRVRQAASAIYFHGMTKELALQVAGYEAVPVLRQLLADPTFHRPDNVVMLLGFLGDDEVMAELIEYFEAANIEWGNPEHERALNLVPQMMGHAAGDGSDVALQFLMDASADGQVVVTRAHTSPDADRQTKKLMDNVFTGLANSGLPIAQARLQDLATGRIAPLSGNYAQLVADATVALERYDDIVAGRTATPDGELWEDGYVDGEVLPPPPAGPAPLDTNPRVHMHAMTVSNHVDMFNQITDTRADDITDSASATMGTGNYSDDVVCCNTMERDLAVNEFGSRGDGLDVINNNNELNLVIPGFGRRVKMVDQINYCGGTGTGILGCSWVGGMGMAQVRMGLLQDEGMLWAHEYGHNVGLNHVSDSRNIMYAYLTGGNYVLTQSQCNTYHSPNFNAQADRTDIGACTDTDNDDIHDVYEGGPQSGWAVSITGTCPGAITIAISGGTPNGQYQSLTANLVGVDPVPNGACAGTPTELWNPVDRGTRTLNAQGGATINANVGTSFCGDYAQIVDISTCSVTPLEQLPL